MSESTKALKTATEWLQYLIDENSEVPFIPPRENGAGFGDEIITLLARVSGRPVAIWSNRAEINQGYISSQGAIKIQRLMERAVELGIPLVSLVSSIGISVQEGVTSGDEYSRVLMLSAQLSGVIPQITCVMGVNIGAPAYSASLSDFVLFNRLRSHLCVSPPSVVQTMIGQEATFANLGGSDMHSSKTGLANFVDGTIQQQLDRCRWLLEFLPSHSKEDPPRFSSLEPTGPWPEIPFEPQITFDMALVLKALCDRSFFVEYSAQFGTSMLCAWAHIGGHPVGIIANQSLHLSGAIDHKAADKSARFIKLCDQFNIPILTLIDCPGFMPGVEQESAGILSAGARLIQSMNTRVPKLSVVIRKCYGAAAIVLAQTRKWHGDLVLALPSSRNAVMGFQTAKDIKYKNDTRSDKELEKDYFETQESPDVSFSRGLVDEIVQPKQLRTKLIQHLGFLELKRPNRQRFSREIQT